MKEQEILRMLVAFVIGGAIVGIVVMSMNSDSSSSESAETSSSRSGGPPPPPPAGGSSGVNTDLGEDLLPDIPTEPLAIEYGKEFVRRALKDPDAGEFNFAKLRARPTAKTRWNFTGVYRADDHEFPIKCKIIATRFEGEWYWETEGMTIGGKEFPDEKHLDLTGETLKVGGQKKPTKLNFTPPASLNKSDEDE